MKTIGENAGATNGRTNANNAHRDRPMPVLFLRLLRLFAARPPLSLACALLTAAGTLQAAEPTAFDINTASGASGNERGVTFFLTNQSSKRATLDGSFRIAGGANGPRDLRVYARYVESAQVSTSAPVPVGGPEWTLWGSPQRVTLVDRGSAPDGPLTSFHVGASLPLEPGQSVRIAILGVTDQGPMIRYTSLGQSAFANGVLAYTGNLGIGTSTNPNFDLSHPGFKVTTFGPVRNFVGSVGYLSTTEPVSYAGRSADPRQVLAFLGMTRFRF